MVGRDGVQHDQEHVGRPVGGRAARIRARAAFIRLRAQADDAGQERYEECGEADRTSRRKPAARRSEDGTRRAAIPVPDGGTPAAP